MTFFGITIDFYLNVINGCEREKERARECESKPNE